MVEVVKSRPREQVILIVNVLGQVHVELFERQL